MQRALGSAWKGKSAGASSPCSLLGYLHPDTSPVLSNQPLSERVYLQLRQMLKTVPRDTRLPGELEMAGRFGVSRPVLRQALERLRAEGLIYARKGSGNFVGSPPQVVPFGPLTSIADVRSFLEFRCNLESEMVALAARNPK
ncbi:FadR/GntR family transcriptional regulator [Cupriavidus sp. NPDC089707]|uniref:FadR/GntR family transcriptional regulator n=1 Tax=Cupriavidus sp. NPDC089707 TaxID=3363963 RepID=UPI0038222691